MITYGDIIKAFPAIQELRKLKLPYKTAVAIFRLSKDVETAGEFYSQEETKLVREYARRDANGNPMVSQSGVIRFDTAENKAEYFSRVMELRDMDTGIQCGNILISADDMGDQTLSAETIDAVSAFVVFE